MMRGCNQIAEKMPMMHLKKYFIVMTHRKSPNSFMLHQHSNLAPYFSKLHFITCLFVPLNILFHYTQKYQNLLKCFPLHMVFPFGPMDGMQLLNLQTPRTLRRQILQRYSLYFQCSYHDLNFLRIETIPFLNLYFLGLANNKFSEQLGIFSALLLGVQIQDPLLTAHY